jgi:hypothetical protein
VIFRPRRGDGDLPLPKHPYRDSAALNGVLAVLLLVIAWATGGDVVRAVVVAAVFFVVATAWSWWRFRNRIAERDAGAGRPPE